MITFDGIPNGRDLDQELEERAYQFLRCTLVFVANFLETGVDELAIVLEYVFDQRAQPFYVNRSSLRACGAQLFLGSVLLCFCAGVAGERGSVCVRESVCEN